MICSTPSSNGLHWSRDWGGVGAELDRMARYVRAVECLRPVYAVHPIILDMPSVEVVSCEHTAPDRLRRSEYGSMVGVRREPSSLAYSSMTNWRFCAAKRMSSRTGARPPSWASPPKQLALF
jgi:hypothetical protein